MTKLINFGLFNKLSQITYIPVLILLSAFKPLGLLV